jgi:hypothetical protein
MTVRRWTAICIIVPVVLWILVGLVLLGVHWSSVQHWLAVHSGTDIPNGQYSVYYNFWSGIGSDIGEVVLIGGLVTLVRHHNCHNKGCWRIGLHTTNTGYKLCKTHVALPLDDLDLHSVHEDHV